VWDDVIADNKRRNWKREIIKKLLGKVLEELSLKG
jgi:hypothetical protein